MTFVNGNTKEQGFVVQKGKWVTADI